MNAVAFRIEGMHCDGCAQRIKAILEREPGVRDAAVSFAGGLARVKYNLGATSEGRLAQVIERGGYSVPARQP